MFELVIGNLLSAAVQQVVLVAREEFASEISSTQLESHFAVPFEVVTVRQTTAGPADSVRLSEPYINADCPVVVANSDQYVDFEPSGFYSRLVDDLFAGAILAMEDTDPKWSYVQVDSANNATSVAEKRVISRLATVGIYGFATGNLLFEAIRRMEEAGDRTNGELYLAPAYNYLLEEAKPIHVIDLGPTGEIMHGLGTPRDLEEFLMNPSSKVFLDTAKKRFNFS